MGEWVPFLEKHPEVQIVIPASDVSHFANPNPIWVVIINMTCEVGRETSCEMGGWGVGCGVCWDVG